ncbi:Transcription factor grauzone [Lucilia cuprina]|uniref:Transcription factor grauzone n=1 Tax=Lucilia cuprina TaxID=7375 RepID=A0A0L0CIE0_LUCCU|nr:Transcription factor grauzone [Lucilia cuprina]
MKQTSAHGSPWICRQCWQELSNFHAFYLKVKKVHKQYDLQKWPQLKCSTKDNDEYVSKTIFLYSVKEEFKLIDSTLETTLEEDLVPLDKFKRNIQNNNSAVINENIEINELPIIESVKDEDLPEDSDEDGQSNRVDNDSWDNNLDDNVGNNEITTANRKKETTKKLNLKIDFLKLKTHYRLEHQTLGYAMCCNKKFYNRGPLADHLRVHKNPNYFKCTICQRILAHRLSYENHLEFHKQENKTRERIFRCEKCDKSFFKKAVYDRHILSHVPEEDRKFQCDECDKKFAAEYLVNQHKAFAHLNKYGKICDICGKTFRERFSFTRHMAEHNGKPPEKVPCDICGVELTSKYLLNRHKKKMHTEENQQEQKCPYCSKVSPNMHAHRQHVNYAHTMKRKHACNMCEKKFKRPLELKEHLSTHTGEPLYTCPHCTRTFISSANMHKHRKASHPKEWQESRLKKLNDQKLRELTIKEHLNRCATTNDDVATILECSQENGMQASSGKETSNVNVKQESEREVEYSAKVREKIKTRKKFKTIENDDMNLLEVKSEFYFNPDENDGQLEKDVLCFDALDVQTFEDCKEVSDELESDEDNKRHTKKSRKVNQREKTKRNTEHHPDVKKPQKKLKQNKAKEELHANTISENVKSDIFTDNEHKLECCICNVTLEDFRAVKQHYRNEHNTKGYTMCCGKKYFKRCLLIDHLRVHKDPNYFKCTECAKVFATRRGLEMHLEIHQTRERKFNCDECGKSYFKLHVFERHKLSHVPESERHYNCSQCDKKFASDYLRRQHEDLTHEKKYDKICDICGKSFRHRFSFARHMEEHDGTTPTLVSCEICGAKLTNKYGLRRHMKMRHLEENMQEQICPYCSRVSPNLNAHRMHIKYNHTMQRKHACHLCEKAFRRPLELKEHLSTHTGEALYTCPHCPRTFISNANMHKHRKIAHRQEWEEARLRKLNEKGMKCVNVSETLPSVVDEIQKRPENLVYIV